jgi:hypothetical protein
MACSAAMGFLADHHWYVTNQLAEWFDETFWWVQLAGAVLSVISGIGMAKSLTDTLALRIGAGLILAGLLVVVLGGGPSDIFNVHDWEIVLVLPLLVMFLDGTVLIYTSVFR